MNENEITDAVCAHLATTGWQVLCRCSTTEQGIDIIAKRNGQNCFIESKGGTSSREGSARYGKPYTESQVLIESQKAFTRLPASAAKREMRQSLGSHFQT